MSAELRWVDGPSASREEWERIDGLLASRGWMSLNRATTRILLAESAGELKGYLVFQAIPFLGPMFITPSARGNGLPETMLKEMRQFLASVDARGWIVIAESPHTERLCEEWGLKKITYPVYAFPDPGGVGDS